MHSFLLDLEVNKQYVNLEFDIFLIGSEWDIVDGGG